MDINIQIELKPKPWYERWERRHLKGVIGLEKYMSQGMRRRQFIEDKPWEKYDLVKTYRSVSFYFTNILLNYIFACLCIKIYDFREIIPEEEQNEIWSDVYTQLQQLELTRKKMSRKRTFVIPKKTA